jgi:nucleotidyltransferase/DNA polymerase involved in DNA repair
MIVNICSQGVSPVAGRRKIIFLADMESFYASVETALNPSLRGKPVVVCGDPVLRHGIVLAASKEAKACGIKAGQPAWECRRLCPGAVFVRPHMHTYLEYSMRITQIFEQFTDRVVPYSIDEQFLDLTGCEGLFGAPREIARAMIRRVGEETGIRCRIGLGENPLQAKMACDCFAKRAEDAFFELNAANYAAHTWPLPIGKLFGVGHRMERNFHHMAVRTIGHLAGLPREALARRWGVSGEILWLNAHGIDHSTVEPGGAARQKGVGHAMTLPRDYATPRELAVVLLELTEEVCLRARALGKMGGTVHVYCRGADFDRPSGFSRQKKLPEPTSVTMDVYPHALSLFRRHWDGQPVRAVGVSLTGLTDRDRYQLSLFNRRAAKDALGEAMDGIRERFGATSIFRAASLTPGAQLFRRAGMIGGHEA